MRKTSAYLWLAFVAPMANAATFTVDSTDDLPDALLGDGHCASSLGSCTLRAAIMEANLNTSGSSLVDLPAGIYRFSIAPQGTDDAGSGDLNLAALPGTNILIQGAGPGRTIVDANQLGSVFRVEDHSEVMLSGLTIRNGSRTSTSQGSGVRSTGILTIIDANIENNTATLGGGVYLGAAPDNSSSATIINTTVQHNHASVGFGGGITTFNTMLSLYNSTINDNSAITGGGLYSAGTSYIVNSTIANNTADEDGGGIYNFINVVFVYNTTITGNDADHDQDDVGGFGGGVANSDDASARFGLVNSLLSSNTVRFVPVDSNCSGIFELYGTNLASSVDVTCATTNANFALLTPSLIGPLQDNGGATFTQALLPGSEAIDTSLDALGCVDERGAPLASDQRGAHRPAGARCDVGAYEYGSIPPITDTIFANGFE